MKLATHRRLVELFPSCALRRDRQRRRQRGDERGQRSGSATGWSSAASTCRRGSDGDRRGRPVRRGSGRGLARHGDRGGGARPRAMRGPRGRCRRRSWPCSRSRPTGSASCTPAIEDGAVVVVAASVSASLIDNLDHAWVRVYTRPEHRRRGHGSAMLAHVEQVAARAGPHGAGRRGRLAVRPAGGRLGRGGRRVPAAARLPVRARRRAPGARPPRRRRAARRAWPTRPRRTTRRTRSGRGSGPVPDDIVESFAELVATADGRGAHRRPRARAGERGRRRAPAGARSSARSRGARRTPASPWTRRARWWPTPTS